MKNTFGSDLLLTIFGESHGRAIGAVLDGMAAGVPVDEAFLAACMDKRRARGDGLSTPRVEADAVQLLSGVVNGRTTGTDALAWAAGNGYLADCTAKNSDDTLTRGDMALILAAYLRSDNANADRLDAQRKVIRDALAQGGDGKMYVFVPELNVPGKASKPGDCTFLVFPDGETMLLDTGVNTCADQIVQLLKDFGVKELDYLVISHPHIDHVGGAVTAVEYLKSIGGTVKHFWHSPADLKNYMANVEAVLPADTQNETLLSGEARTIGRL